MNWIEWTALGLGVVLLGLVVWYVCRTKPNTGVVLGKKDAFLFYESAKSLLHSLNTL
jgi:hypothetical protein